MRLTVLGGMVLLAVTAAAAAASCGGEITKCLDCDYACGDVVCENSNDFVMCDPTDGLCKCGDLGLNLICGPNEVCTPQGADQFACLSTRCELQECDPGETCNPFTGECACGTGPDARKCDEKQTCENGRCTPGICDAVECTLGSSCDPEDGSCKCGTVICDKGVMCLEGRCTPGPDPCDPSVSIFVPECNPGEECVSGVCTCAGASACLDNERCVGGSCVPDVCFGVNCSAGLTCNPQDSLCHCGGETGPLCFGGQTCEAGSCVGATDPCEGTDCDADRFCDSSSGAAVCRCALPDDHPACPDPGICTASGCQPGGRNPCAGRDCDGEVPGSSCDPEDGVCKCGGLEGIPCEDAPHVCRGSGDAWRCTVRCHPLVRGVCEGPEGACYYDTKLGYGVCETAGDTVGEGCRASSDCVEGSFCAPVEGREGVCRELCDLAAADRGAPTGCPDTKVCSPLPGSIFPEVGQCLSVR